IAIQHEIVVGVAVDLVERILRDERVNGLVNNISICALITSASSSRTYLSFSNTKPFTSSGRGFSIGREYADAMDALRIYAVKVQLTAPAQRDAQRYRTADHRKPQRSAPWLAPPLPSPEHHEARALVRSLPPRSGAHVLLWPNRAQPVRSAPVRRLS